MQNNNNSLSSQGNDIICQAAKWSPKLTVAYELWKEIKFEFDTIDTI
jgi:ribulose-bisphosphate carboxylase large chain